MHDMSIDDIKGRSVIDSRGTHIGSIEDVAVDTDRWSVTGLIVGLRDEVARDLHVDKPFMGSARVTFRPDRIHAVGDSVILNVDSDEVAGLLRERS